MKRLFKQKPPKITSEKKNGKIHHKNGIVFRVRFSYCRDSKLICGKIGKFPSTLRQLSFSSPPASSPRRFLFAVAIGRILWFFLILSHG